jgi:hypothetical protein
LDLSLVVSLPILAAKPGWNEPGTGTTVPLATEQKKIPATTATGIINPNKPNENLGKVRDFINITC